MNYRLNWLKKENFPQNIKIIGTTLNRIVRNKFFESNWSNVIKNTWKVIITRVS